MESLYQLTKNSLQKHESPIKSFLYELWKSDTWFEHFPGRQFSTRASHDVRRNDIENVLSFMPCNFGHRFDMALRASFAGLDGGRGHRRVHSSYGNGF